MSIQAPKLMAPNFSNNNARPSPNHNSIMPQSGVDTAGRANPFQRDNALIGVMERIVATNEDLQAKLTSGGEMTESEMFMAKLNAQAAALASNLVNSLNDADYNNKKNSAKFNT